MMIFLENLLETQHSYFAHSLMKQFELIKLVKFMRIKMNKILSNVKIRWISMLITIKKMMVK